MKLMSSLTVSNLRQDDNLQELFADRRTALSADGRGVLKSPDYHDGLNKFQLIVTFRII